MIEETILDILSSYGVLGLWTLWLLWQHNNHNKRIETVINNNTEALNEFKYKHAVEGHTHNGN
mgnify:CR=1 FL=1